MFNQIMNSVLERAGLKLLLVVDHHHAVLAVVVRLEAWHATLLVDLTPDYQIRGFSTASTPPSAARGTSVGLNGIVRQLILRIWYLIVVPMRLMRALLLLTSVGHYARQFGRASPQCTNRLP